MSDRRRIATVHDRIALDRDGTAVVQHDVAARRGIDLGLQVFVPERFGGRLCRIDAERVFRQIAPVGGHQTFCQRLFP